MPLHASMLLLRTLRGPMLVPQVLCQGGDAPLAKGSSSSRGGVAGAGAGAGTGAAGGGGGSGRKGARVADGVAPQGPSTSDGGPSSNPSKRGRQSGLGDWVGGLGEAADGAASLSAAAAVGGLDPVQLLAAVQRLNPAFADSTWDLVRPGGVWRDHGPTHTTYQDKMQGALLAR